jgi:hypothetical protein
MEAPGNAAVEPSPKRAVAEQSSIPMYIPGTMPCVTAALGQPATTNIDARPNCTPIYTILFIDDLL